MLKILVADNYNIHRIGLVQILIEAFPGAVVDEANDTHSLFIKISTGSWDLIISGFILPIDEGVKIIQKIKADPRISIAACGMEIPKEKVDYLLEAGADGFIDKGAKASLIVRQIEKLLATNR